jgi:translation initiation factor IF-2
VAGDGNQASCPDAVAALDERAATAEAAGHPWVPVAAAAGRSVEAHGDWRPDSVNPVQGQGARPRADSDSPLVLAAPSVVAPADARGWDGVAVPVVLDRFVDLRRASGSSAAARVRSAAASPAAPVLQAAVSAWAVPVRLEPQAPAAPQRPVPRPRAPAQASQPLAQAPRQPSARVGEARPPLVARRRRLVRERRLVQERQGRPRAAAAQGSPPGPRAAPGSSPSGRPRASRS